MSLGPDGVIFCTPTYLLPAGAAARTPSTGSRVCQTNPSLGSRWPSNPLPRVRSAAAASDDLRRMMVFLDALTLNKPESFIGGCAAKLDDKTGALKDQATGKFIAQQLEAFAKFIERHGGKA